MAENGGLSVVVTGASRGLGLEITHELASRGYRVVAVSRALSKELQDAKDEYSDQITHLSADLLKTDQLKDVIRRARSIYGPLYGLVNNAGIGTDGLLSNMHLSHIEALIRLNITAPIALSKYAVRDMMLTGRGRVINMSSIVASTGYSGLSVYAATKSSMVGFTKSLARELGRLGITVNAVAPGFIDTDMTHSFDAEGRDRVVRRSALKRLAEPIDIARTVSFLMGEEGRNITGQIITVDAGATA